MIINDDPTQWVLSLSVAVLFLFAGLLLAFRPEQFVMWLGRTLHSYARSRNLTDTQIDRMQLPGTKTWYGGNLSKFIREAEHSPSSYSWMTNYVRWFGVIMVAVIVGMILLGLLLLVLVYLSPFVSVCFSSQPGCVP